MRKNKIMKQLKIFLIIFIFLYSCRSEKKDVTGVIGKYINSYEADASHYVELKSDSSFFHFYKKGSDTERINEGKWSSKEKNGFIEITFNTWTTFGYDNGEGCPHCLWSVKLKNDELIFNIDLPIEMNFKKIN